MKSNHVFLILLGLAFASGAFSGCKSDSEEEKIAILVTDWGTPDGMDLNYYRQIGHRSRVGIAATAAEASCEEDFNGVYPYRSFHGVYPHFLAFSVADEEKYPDAAPWMVDAYDGFGVYWKKNDAGVYVNIVDETVTTTDEDIAAAAATTGEPIAVFPASSINFGRGRAIFTPDTRPPEATGDGTPDGVDHLADMVIIGKDDFNGATCKDSYTNFPNGVSDMDELDMAYWWRTVRMMDIREFDTAEDAEMNPFYDLMGDNLTEYFATFFGDKVDIRFGNYEAVTGLTERSEDVAIQFADEGFKKMVLTRETTDNNDYANVSMTRHLVDYGLCQAGYDENDIDIVQVKQIGRTPEYNTMVGNILDTHLTRLDESGRLTSGNDQIAIAYTTYGNPWPGTSPDISRASAVSHPWVSDVYPENAYYNYLSFKRYAEDRFSDYNLTWSRSGTTAAEEDFRKQNYYSYAMFQKEFYTIEYDTCDTTTKWGSEFKNVRENIERMKFDGVKTAIFLVSHWYFNSIDNGLAQRDVQKLPMNTYEELAANQFWKHWCEPSVPGNNTWSEVSPDGFTCANPDDILIIYTECFDDFDEEMIAGYAQRIRGGVERYGVLPKLGITVEANADVTKLGGGTAEITSGPRAGAKIVVPEDPDPDAPEHYYPIPDQRPIKYETINDPSDPKIGAWFDFTVLMGEQRKVTPEEDLPMATNAVGPAVYIGPYRTLVNKPARVTLPYRSDGASGETITPRIFNDLTKTWDPVYPVSGGEGVVVDEANGTVSFDTQVLGIFVPVAN